MTLGQINVNCDGEDDCDIDDFDVHVDEDHSNHDVKEQLDRLEDKQKARDDTKSIIDATNKISDNEKKRADAGNGDHHDLDHHE